MQVALSLAVAEAALEFEHRDLHWGNVLVKRTKETTLLYTLDGDDIEISTHGVRVAVIDFTLSRLRKGKDSIHVEGTIETVLKMVGFRCLKEFHQKENLSIKK